MSPSRISTSLVAFMAQPVKLPLGTPKCSICRKRTNVSFLVIQCVTSLTPSLLHTCYLSPSLQYCHMKKLISVFYAWWYPNSHDKMAYIIHCFGGHLFSNLCDASLLLLKYLRMFFGTSFLFNVFSHWKQLWPSYTCLDLFPKIHLQATVWNL